MKYLTLLFLKKTLHSLLRGVLFVFVMSTCYAADNVVNVYVWGGEVPDSLVKQFEKDTGIRVNFSTYDSNETLYAKLVASSKPLYDVIEPSSYYLDRMRRQGMLEPINTKQLNNYKNINPLFIKQKYDPAGEYSIPWFWGITGIFYNDKYFQANQVQNWNDLWSAQFHNRLVLLDDTRDIFSAALIHLGYSANDADPQHIQQAYQSLRQLMPNIKLFASDTVRGVIIDEDAAAGIMWNGDLYAARQENPHLHFVYPKQGFVIWVDAFAIPKNAPHLANALKFLNYVMRAKVASRAALEEGFATANAAGEKLLPEKIRNNPLLYPDANIVKRGQFQTDVTDGAVALYAKYWELLKIEG